ncbi:MAG TPA: carotenoid oxygenase family protein [Acidimicrobiia bacterium]|nr:carotenoid oxygenase family protein [Acidimicrobiia bacterium]
MTVTENPYLAGNFAPVDDEVTAFDLPVTGELPRELSGRLLRIGPNPVGVADPLQHHWFVGSGMVHGLRIRDGRAEWYRNRFVRDEIVGAVKGWPEIPGPRHGMGANVANTNVIAHAGRTWAIVEAGGLPVELTDELETVARSNFDGSLPGSFTAHPKRDPQTGELHAVVYYWEWDYLEYVVVGTDGRVRKVVDVPVPGKPMVHDCAITETQVLLFDLPVTFDLEVAMQGQPLPYRWDPDYGARVGVLPLDGDAADVRWCELDELLYTYHPLNAYDAGDGTVVLDTVVHPKMFAADVRGPNEGPPVLERWTLDPAAGKVRRELLSDREQEFPRMHEGLIGRRHRYGYGAEFLTSHDGVRLGSLLKHDVDRITTDVHDVGPGRAAMEPVFVPRAGATAEDDGWVLSYVHDATRDACDVVVLDAQDFAAAPVATVHLPARVPFGFHGNWVPDEG